MDATISANIERFQELFNNVSVVAPLNAVRGTAGTGGVGRGHLSRLTVGVPHVLSRGGMSVNRHTIRYC